ncbi:glycosyltransferase family 2 protein [bacterium]|nr:MAG: glycosyltransferase family 2 protein [bacterium]
MKKLSVIIPAYNEEKKIGENLKETLKSLEKMGCNFEIILVSDGSADSTVEEAMLVSDPRIKTYQYEKNMGKGFAIKYGFSRSSGDAIVFLDGDMEIHPGQLKLYIDTMKKTGADIVIGSKRHPESMVNYPFKRVILSMGYQFLNKLLFNLNLTDTQAGLKLFRREVLEEILPKVLVKKYAFDLELLVNANHRNYRIVEAPIKIDFNLNSHVGLKNILNIFVDTCAIFYRLKILKYYQRR